MKLHNFQEWKNQFMIDSNPKTGNKVGIRINHVTTEKLSEFEDNFLEIYNKYMKYNIIVTIITTSYEGVSISENAYVMIFDSIDEIRNQKNNPLLEDIFDMFVTIEINNDTKYYIKKIQKQSFFEENDNLDYNGIDLTKENVPEILCTGQKRIGN